MDYEIVERDDIECLSPKSVMKLLEISKTEAYNLFHSKGFPYFRIGETGKNLRVTRRDFKNWLNEQKKKGGCI